MTDMLNLEGYSGVERYYHTERCLVYTDQGIEWTKKIENLEREYRKMFVLEYCAIQCTVYCALCTSVYIVYGVWTGGSISCKRTDIVWKMQSMRVWARE